MGLLGGCDQFVDLAEVDLADDFGFTIDALVEHGRSSLGVAVDFFYAVRLSMCKSCHTTKDR